MDIWVVSGVWLLWGRLLQTFVCSPFLLELSHLQTLLWRSALLRLLFPLPPAIGLLSPLLASCVSFPYQTLLQSSGTFSSPSSVSPLWKQGQCLVHLSVPGTWWYYVFGWFCFLSNCGRTSFCWAFLLLCFADVPSPPTDCGFVTSLTEQVFQCHVSSSTCSRCVSEPYFGSSCNI